MEMTTMLLDKGFRASNNIVNEPCLLACAIKNGDLNFVQDLLNKYNTPHSAVRRKNFQLEIIIFNLKKSTQFKIIYFYKMMDWY